jgi:hypothetical protein
MMQVVFQRSMRGWGIRHYSQGSLLGNPKIWDTRGQESYGFACIMLAVFMLPAERKEEPSKMSIGYLSFRRGFVLASQAHAMSGG